jgi:hypothetical protein
MRRHLLALGRSSRGGAAALFPAIAGLVDSIPAGSEIHLESDPAAAADVLIGLYHAALATDRRTPAGPPPRLVSPGGERAGLHEGAVPSTFERAEGR